jgi:hypothetical protein
MSTVSALSIPSGGDGCGGSCNGLCASEDSPSCIAREAPSNLVEPPLLRKGGARNQARFFLKGLVLENWEKPKQLKSHARWSFRLIDDPIYSNRFFVIDVIVAVEIGLLLPA